MAIKREACASPARFKHEVVPVPERDDVLYVWGRSAADSEQPKAGDDAREATTRFVASCCGDESGPFSPPWTAAELAGSVTLGTLGRVTTAALDVNGMSEKAAEELQGN